MSIMTPVGLLSFPALFKPRSPVPGAATRFSAVLVIDAAGQGSPEFKALRQACYDCAVEKFGKRMENPTFVKGLRSPFRDAGEKADKYAGYNAGDVFISAWTKGDGAGPGVVDARLQDMIEADVWPGQLARFTVNPFAYDQTGNTGVSLGLANVQITKRNMPRLDGRAPANKEFGTVAEEDSPALAPNGAGVAVGKGANPF